MSDPRGLSLVLWLHPAPLTSRVPRGTRGAQHLDLQKFVCGQCWRNWQVVEPDKDLKAAALKARHW